MVARVLLTGGNGFIGAHILDQLLARGVSVRCVVRSQEKAEQVRADHGGGGGGDALDFFVAPDITAAGAFDEAVKSERPFDTVIHTASPFLFAAVTHNVEFLEPAVRGTTELLRAAQAFAPRVRRVIVTSSFAAVIDRHVA